MRNLQLFTVVLNLPNHPADLVTFGGTVIKSMSPPNPWFVTPPPDPALVDFSQHLEALGAAEVLVGTGVGSAIAARNGRQAVVIKDFNHIGHYVQRIADENPGREVEIITSASLFVKQKGVRTVAVFQADDGDEPGSVLLIAPGAGNDASHYWQGSSNQVDWIAYPETKKRMVTLTGFTPGTKWYFRHRLLTRKGYSEWETTSLIIR